MVCGLVVVIFATFSPAIHNGFLNWDDETHLTDYIPLRTLNLESLRKIFSDSIHKTYIPLPTLTFAIEYHFFKLNPLIYHLDNIILHCAVAILVLLVGLRLGLSGFAAFIAALIFALHPTHVETVSWATERKGLLYSVFFLLAMLNYLKYLAQKKRLDYSLSIIWGTLSILSKPMAVSLPLILWLLDWWQRRPFNKTLLLDKIPYIFTVIPIALITYLQHVRVPFKYLDEGLLVWLWTFLFYPKQFVFPLSILPIYRLPQPVSLANLNYILDICLFLTLSAIFIRLRKNRWLVFAALFYLATTFFLLRLDKGHDLNLVADRYMYLASLGFCFLAAKIVEYFLARAQKVSQISWTIAYCLIILALILCAKKSYSQAQIWKDPMTFWSHVIKKRPDEFIAYNNRGIIHVHQDKLDLALNDFDKAIELFGRYDEAYNNRGNLYRLEGQFSKAYLDFSKAILCNPKNYDAYNNRAITFSHQGAFYEALADLDKALEINPQLASAYYNRANIFSETGMYFEAVRDYTKAIEINPFDSASFNNRGALYLRLGMSDEALADFNQALEINPHELSASYNRLLLLEKKNKLPQASNKSAGK